jgi:hypothetical protein
LYYTKYILSVDKINFVPDKINFASCKIGSSEGGRWQSQVAGPGAPKIL